MMEGPIQISLFILLAQQLMGAANGVYLSPLTSPASTRNVMSLTMCLAQMSQMNDKYVVRLRDSPLPSRQRVSFATSRQSTCPTGKRLFRTADGFCNNILRPSEGQSFERFKRFLKPQYDDGSSTPRTRGKCFRRLKKGRFCRRKALPSARAVSTCIHPQSDVDSTSSVMLMQWGQFLDHDFTAAAIVQPDEARKCCDHRKVQKGKPHPDVKKSNGNCFPIIIPPGDRFFNKCMEFVRSRAIDDNFSQKDPREQQNLLTAFVDASNVYGSDIESQRRLRGSNGRMAVSANNLLPRGRDTDCVRANSPFCFDAGDERVHVFPGLTALHTAFVRYHNIIVKQLDDGTNWGEERLFQETRKIVGAVIQRITYLEFLTEVLNEKFIRKFRLNEGNYAYNISINPSIASSFATAAFRYGHSLIPNFLVIDGKKVMSRQLFNDPRFIFTSLDSIVENILSNPAQMRDRFLTEEITDHLFESTEGPFDLAAFNIQRGRDHGLPPYNDFREFCGFPRVRSFKSRVFNRAGNALSTVYRTVDDIDLFAGAMTEKNLPNSELGPTFSCIIASQMSDLKFGDSFWYETSDKSRGFTGDQLKALKKVTLSQILCEVFNLQKIQRNPFRIVSKKNPLVNCNRLAPLDTTFWTNRR